MTDPELSDDEVERRMRRSLFLSGKSSRSDPDDIAQQAQRVAEKWMGTNEAQRLQNRRGNSRPFKPKKPVVAVEYYEVPPMQCDWSNAFGGGWRIDVRVDGILRNSKEGLSREKCLKLVADCERRGAKSKPIITEWMKHNTSMQEALPSKRKSFAERYGDLAPEVDDD